MADEIPAAAPAAPAAPAPAAPAAAPVADSLIPDRPAADVKADAAPAADAAKKDAPVADPKAPSTADIAKKEADHAAWFYADGTPGKGEMPSWYKADKYKTVEDQAKAYPELEKRLGAFKGAPKDGKYEFKMPEGLGNLTLDESHPLMGDFQKWAADRNLSQEGYQELLGMLAQYEAAQVPDMNSIKAEIGEDADKRINAVVQWSTANLSPEEHALLKTATTDTNAAQVFLLVEALVGKTKQVALPKPGRDVAAALPQGEAGLRALNEKKGPDGRLLIFTDPVHRAKVDQATREYFEGQSNAT